MGDNKIKYSTKLGIGLLGTIFAICLLAFIFGKSVLVLLLPILVGGMLACTYLVWLLIWFGCSIWDMEWSKKNRDNCIAGVII